MVVLKKLSNVFFITFEKKRYDTHFYVSKFEAPNAPTSIRLFEIILYKHEGSIKDFKPMMGDDMLIEELKGTEFNNAEELKDRVRQSVTYLPEPSHQTTAALETSAIMV